MLLRELHLCFCWVSSQRTRPFEELLQYLNDWLCARTFISNSCDERVAKRKSDDQNSF